MTPTKLNAAQKWFDAGLDEANKFISTWRKARAHVANAGFLFMRAREACAEGNWLFLLQTNASKMKPRTVQFYIQLAEAALAWALVTSPGLTGAKLEEAAREVMMESPKPLVALLRDLKELRPFGEYDAIKYRLKKIGNGSEQMELNFEKVFSTFDALEHDFVFTLPEGKSEAEALRELKEKCDRVSATLGTRLEGMKTTDI